MHRDKWINIFQLITKPLSLYIVMILKIFIILILSLLKIYNMIRIIIALNNLSKCKHRFYMLKLFFLYGELAMRWWFLIWCGCFCYHVCWGGFFMPSYWCMVGSVHHAFFYFSSFGLCFSLDYGVYCFLFQALSFFFWKVKDVLIKANEAKRNLR